MSVRHCGVSIGVKPPAYPVLRSCEQMTTRPLRAPTSTLAHPQSSPRSPTKRSSSPVCSIRDAGRDPSLLPCSSLLKDVANVRRARRLGKRNRPRRARPRRRQHWSCPSHVCAGSDEHRSDPRCSQVWQGVRVARPCGSPKCADRRQCECGPCPNRHGAPGRRTGGCRRRTRGRHRRNRNGQRPGHQVDT